MKHLILEDLIEEVSISGLMYKINTSFRNVMRFEILMDDEEIEDREKLKIALEMFFGDQFIVNESEAIQAVLYFYTGREFEPNKKKTGEGDSDPIYSFLEDDEYIFVSFVEAYGIDLSTVDMHWWKFKALFYNLPENTIMAKVMGYRAMEMRPNMSAEERTFYRNMKKLYGLKKNKSAKEKEVDFASALWG